MGSALLFFIFITVEEKGLVWENKMVRKNNFPLKHFSQLKEDLRGDVKVKKVKAFTNESSSLSENTAPEMP